MKALLVRIGIDQSYGRWNAPVDADGRFVFVPIPESTQHGFHEGLGHCYGEVLPALDRFCAGRGVGLFDELKFPENLLSSSIHLDPDFDHLTYGDDGAVRGAGIVDMVSGDLLVFYAGLKPIYQSEHKLLYAIVGIYVVQEVSPILAIPAQRWHENAHTRKLRWGSSDIVVRAKADLSGRLERCIPIGEWRDGAYRVSQSLIEKWGGLNVKDGFIQRSIVPPSFKDSARFYEWFLQQNGTLLKGNGWK